MGLGKGVIMGGGVAVLSTQNSDISGFSLGLNSISRQVTAPSLTAKRVVPSLTSTSICEGMLKSDMGQMGVKSSYECSCAVNRRIPSRKVTSKRGRVCGFFISMMVPGVSSSKLPSPMENSAPSTVSAMIRHVSAMAMFAPFSNIVHSDSFGHCTLAFPADR